jgi:acetylglutamate kinase
MVLSGSINKEIVSWIAAEGGRAVGISGKDGRLVTATKIKSEHDLGFVGEPDDVDTRILDTISKAGMIPVVAPIGVGADGQTYNINADTMAGAIAIATGAERLFLLTDVPGVLDKNKKLLSDLTPAAIAALKADGTIHGGMIPKLQTCIDAVEGGVDAAVILDGRVPHAMLIEIFTRQGAGTLVRQG